MSYIRTKAQANEKLTQLLIDTDTDVEHIINYLCNYMTTDELIKLIDFIEEEQQ
jgi:hypothetical protein